MVRLAEIFIAVHGTFALILFLWVFWLRRDDSDQWRCPECETEFVLLQQEAGPTTIIGPALSADLQCPECLSCFDLWRPSQNHCDCIPRANQPSTTSASLSLIN